MPTLAPAGLPDGRSSSLGSDTLPARYPLPYDGTAHIADVSSYFDKQRFSMLVTLVCALLVPFSPGSRNKAVGTRRNL